MAKSRKESAMGVGRGRNSGENLGVLMCDSTDVLRFFVEPFSLPFAFGVEDIG
jgi:hypothetical protein